jgi:HD-GYP domain-containing protein (c-di-GMP phosphodiesterase class II)
LLAVGRQLGIALETLYLVREQVKMLESMMEVLAASIDARDGMTSGHSSRVASYARRLAEKLDRPADDCKQIYWAGLLHDYGKIGIDDDVLRKPGKLDTMEFRHIKLHPQLTYDILKRIHFPEGLETLPFVAATHHERLDGGGYPFGLSGDDFPEGGQIIGIADVFDALTQERHYRDPMPLALVITILEEGKGERWKPELVEAFVQLIHEELRHELEQVVSTTPHGDRA